MKRNISVLLLLFALPLSGPASDEKMGEDSGPSFVLFPIEKSIMSAQVDANITRYPFREGTAFQAGDIIVQLDETLYLQYFSSAKADVDKAKASYEFSKNVYEKSLDMYEKKGLSLQEFEKSKLDYELAISALNQALAAFKIADARVNFCSIKAPFSGSVAKKLKNEHEFVRTGETVIEAINDSKLLAAMNLPSTRFSEAGTWQKKEFYVDELKKSFSGSPYEISADINSGSRTFEIKFLIENPRGELKAGMSGYMIEN